MASAVVLQRHGPGAFLLNEVCDPILIDQGLDYLHRQEVVHGSLKPSNILLSADGTAKLGDFSCLCGSAANNSPVEHKRDIVAFRAPETIQPDSRYRGQAADVYALGACLYALVFGRPPFEATNLNHLLHLVQHEEITFPEDIAISDNLLTLLLRLLIKVRLPDVVRITMVCRGLCVQNPKERITLSAIREHPWVTDYGKHPLPRGLDPSPVRPSSDGQRDLYELIRDLVVYSACKKTYREGECLFCQGEPGAFMLYIISGECEVLLTCRSPRWQDLSGNRHEGSSSDSPGPSTEPSTSSSDAWMEERDMRKRVAEGCRKAHAFAEMQRRDDHQLLIGQRSNGDVVGEISLLAGDGHRTATVRATKRTVVKVLPRDDVAQYLKRHPETQQRLTELAWTRKAESLRQRGRIRLASVHEALIDP